MTRLNFFSNVLIALAVISVVFTLADNGTITTFIITKSIAAGSAWLCWFEYKRWKSMGLLDGFDVEE